MSWRRPRSGFLAIGKSVGMSGVSGIGMAQIAHLMHVHNGSAPRAALRGIREVVHDPVKVVVNLSRRRQGAVMDAALVVPLELKQREGEHKCM
eukprot:scaffold329827_cov210-Tisochrysis_lutea.AAC.1